ncbi:hypothetical protein JCM10207_000766 [Rhodosporidiobolus poonsookiae]
MDADTDAQYSFLIPPPGAAPNGDSSPPSAAVDASKTAKKRKAKQDATAPAPGTSRAAEGEADGAQAAAAAEDEERPLSHKEKRLAKKRKLTAEAAGADEGGNGAVSPPKGVAPPSKAKEAAPTMIGSTLVGNTPARSAHGIWIGNLNFATHARELLAWFSERGLKEVTRINMPNGKRQHENNRGFAYLDFPSETEVTIAVGLSEQHLDGRKLLIKSSSDYTGRPAPSASTSTASLSASDAPLPLLDASALDPAAPVPAPGAPYLQTLNRTARKILDRQKNPAGPTLFIGNLGFETTVDDIRDMFDRNQKKQAEWEPKRKSDKKGRKGKGKKRDDDGSAEEDGEGDDEETERDDDSDESSDEDAGDDGEQAADASAEKSKKRERREKGEPKGPLDLSKAKDAGIRKVRLGTFEDTGKCKGWAFVDFHLPAQATRALLNLRNHALNGRKLNVEYASADAVRRGGLGTRAAGKAAGRARRDGGHGQRGEHDAEGHGKKRPQREWDDGAVRDFATQAARGNAYAERGPPPHKRGAFDGGFARGERPQKGRVGDGKRAKPGAALANAQRASEAIVASTGRRTTFD